MMEVMVKKMTTPMLVTMIRKWRVWNLTKGSIRVMEWASALSADGYWTNTILSDFEWISFPGCPNKYQTKRVGYTGDCLH